MSPFPHSGCATVLPVASGSASLPPPLASVPTASVPSCGLLGAALLRCARTAGGGRGGPPARRARPQARLASRSLLLDVAAAGDRLVAVGERGHVIWSEDRGATWTQGEVPTTATLTGVFMLDRNVGWAVGHDAVVLRTGDGGRTWELQRSAPEEERPLFDVRFADATHGFAIGAYGAFLVTENGGVTWDERPIGEQDVHLHHVSRAPSGTLYIAAESGMLFRSDDSGRSWRELPSPYEGSFFATVPLGGDSLLALGLRGHLFRSDDGGESWTTIDSGTEATLTDGVALAGGRVVVTGLAGVLLVSDDGGRTFALRQQAARQGIVGGRAGRRRLTGPRRGVRKSARSPQRSSHRTQRRKGPAHDRLPRKARLRQPTAGRGAVPGDHGVHGLPGDPPPHRRRVRQAAAAQARVHADVHEAPRGVRRRQPRPHRAAGARRRHLQRPLPRDAARRDRRRVLHPGHRPHARQLAVHAQRALHRGGRGRHLRRQRDSGRLRADPRRDRPGAEERRSSPGSSAAWSPTTSRRR